MSVQALKSSFGKVARGVALALAMTGTAGMGAAMAQETAPATPAQPGAAQQFAPVRDAGFPASCLPVKALDKNVGPGTPYLKQFAEELKDYEGYQALTDALEDSGIVIDGYCGIVAPPDSQTPIIVLDHETTFTSLDLNVTAESKQPDGSVAIGPAPASMVTDNLEGIFLPEAVKKMSATASGRIASISDNLDTTVLIGTIAETNAIAEEALFAIDLYERTGSDKALQHMLGDPSLALYKTDITNLWTTSIGHESSDTELTAQEKNNFRVALVTKALKDPATRQQAYMQTIQMMVGMIAHGYVDPLNSFKNQPTAAQLSARLAKLGPAFAGLNLDAISTELKARSGDPSGPANEAMAKIRKKIQDMINSQNASGPAATAPSAPQP